jgi:predicted nucleic acid-binding protein
VITEAESQALRAFIAGRHLRASSALVRVEVPRAVRRLSLDAAAVTRAEQVTDDLDLIPLDQPILRAAGRLEPAGLRSLDAIHLASALSLGSDLGGIVVYDQRLADAARAAGVGVYSPQ